MTLTHLLGLFHPVVSTLLSPGSNLSIYSLAFSLLVAFAFMAWRRKRRRGSVGWKILVRAIFSRRVLFHRSALADFAYFVLGVMFFGLLIGWAVVSTAAISDGVAAFLTRCVGARASSQAPDIVLSLARTLALFVAYDLGFFFDHTIKHRIPALWELHKAHHSAEVLTPLTNFRVHPLDLLILANNLAIFIGVTGGVIQYFTGKATVSFTLFDTNVLMVAYIYLTAQLQHTQIWIPFTGVWGKLFMSPSHHQLHHSRNPAHFNCNMGASLAIWDWLFSSLELPTADSPRLAYGVPGLDHDPHGVMGLVFDPAFKFAGKLVGWRPAPVKLPQQAPE